MSAEYPWAVEYVGNERTKAAKNIRAELAFRYPNYRMRVRVVRDCVIASVPRRSGVDPNEVARLLHKYWPTSENEPTRSELGSAYTDVELVG